MAETINPGIPHDNGALESTRLKGLSNKTVNQRIR